MFNKIKKFIKSSNTKSETYAEAVKKLKNIENVLTTVQSAVTDVIDGLDSFTIEKNTWVDIPKSDGEGVSIMGLNINSDYTSSLSYFTDGGYSKPHKHYTEWEFIKILDGSLVDETNGLIFTAGDVYLIPKNKEHNLVAKYGECYIYTIHTSNRKYLKITSEESTKALEYINK